MDLRRKYRYTVQYTGKLKTGKMLTKQTIKTYASRKEAQDEAFRLRYFLNNVAKKYITSVTAHKIPVNAQYNVDKHRWG
jgi:hypothetical protein